MIAIRQIQKVKSGAVIIALPPEFDTKQVEIIVLPMDDVNEGAQNLQDLLLAAPTLTDDEIQEFDKAREWMNQWNVNGF